METRVFESGSKLSLTNSGELELFFLGVGSAFSKRHYQTNLLIIKGEDHLLVDCGSRCPQALYEVGLSVVDIKNFFLTHSHSDHIGGMEEVALMGRYVTKQKPLILISEEYQEILWEMSLRGGCAYNEEQAGDILGFEDFFTIKRPRRIKDCPRLSCESEIGQIALRMMRTKHIPDSSGTWETSFWSCGVLIDQRILFTADTRFDPELITTAVERFPLEAIFHDCQFFTGGVHASLDELASLAPEIRAKIWLVHYGDNWEQFEARVEDLGFAGLAKERVSYLF